MLNRDIILKKAERIGALVQETQGWTDAAWSDVAGNTALIRACERNLEIMVELASDINALIVLEKTGRTPDSYKESFRALRPLGILEEELSEILVDSVELRNILVHEYDFEADNEQFFRSLKDALLPAYDQYVRAVVRFMEKES